MFRKIICLLICNLLAAQPVFAQEAADKPLLAPGKPAGFHEAQFASNDAVFVGVLVVALIAGVYLASQPYRIPGEAAVSAPSTS